MNVCLDLLSRSILIADLSPPPEETSTTLEYFMLAGIIYSITVAVEAIVFRQFKWTWKNAFIDALWLNLASAIVDYFMLTFFLIPAISWAANYAILCGIISIVSLSISLAIEVPLLSLVRGQEHQIKLRRAAIVANLCSHVILAVLLILLITLIFIWNFGDR